MNWRLGVDTGGTFTDFVWVGGDGRVQIHKQLSTPHDPSAAILQGIEMLHVPEGTAVVHGSTVATNALLERRGARTALITTKGFADVLEIGRQNRPNIYALVPQKPPPLVPRQWRFELDERITAQGEVLRRLNPDDLRPILTKLAEEQIESVAVCLLFSFLYPAHEQQIQQIISQFPQPLVGNLLISNLPVSLSSTILPEYREYERTSTTVINAYVAPLMSRYLGRLAEGLGVRPLTIMQSNGGVISAEMAGQQAARTALSGPAGGVVGAHYVAAQAGFADLITFDMGGTSTDVALCHGRIPTTTSGHIAGLPLRLPLIDIHTVGAGGGSLAHVDAGGALHVGPQSAGANPGPACYGRGVANDQWSMVNGQWRATVTDAHLVLGRLDADHFLGGTMRLDVEAARAAVAELAGAMGAASVEAAAWGVIQVANANMERAIRHISVERGYDPRLFTLLPFGGAGPLHAAELAASLHIPRVFIPPSPGVLSALGMLVAAPTKDYSKTVMQEIGRLPARGRGDWEIGDWSGRVFADLEERARSEMMAEGHSAITMQYALDMRYKGQSHELTIPLDRPPITDYRLPIADQFHVAHQSRYGYHQPDAAVEIVTIRLTAVAPVTPPLLPQYPMTEPDASAALVGEKEVWFNQQPVLTRLYDRAKLRPGHQFPGPAVIFQYDTTIVVPPAWGTAVDGYGNLLLTKM
jgi:N-methylhydantoinase A